MYIRNPFKRSFSPPEEYLLPYGEFSRDYVVGEISRKTGLERYHASIVFNSVFKESLIMLRGEVI